MTDKRVEAAARAKLSKQERDEIMRLAHVYAEQHSGQMLISSRSPLWPRLVQQAKAADIALRTYLDSITEKDDDAALAAADAAVADEAREMVEQLRRLANLACTRRTERERIHGVADLIERMAGLKGE